MEDGIYTDISIQDYHANKTHYSSTQLKLAKRSLKEFYWYISDKTDRPKGVHLNFGNAFELALLDKSGFEKEVAIEQTKYWTSMAMQANPTLVKPKASKMYGEFADTFADANKGKYFIPDVGNNSFETIEHMLESCYKDAVIQKLIQGTEYQLSLFWTDSETGLKMKTRPDICKRKKNVIVNLKTTEDGSPKAFSRDLANYDYPLQACIEMMGCVATGLMTDVDLYYWLVVEKQPPYNATIYEFAKEDLMWCMDNLRYVIVKTKRALDDNFFPGYSDQAENQYGIMQAQIPLYYKM